MNRRNHTRLFHLLASAAVFTFVSTAQAAVSTVSTSMLDLTEPMGPTVPSTKNPIPNTTLRGNIAYGKDKRQTLDVYAPPNAASLPVIFMVHGGGWRMGDKTNPGVIQNKGVHYTSKGFVFISVNYPLVPDGVMALDEANSVAQALSYVQANAAKWGGDPKKVILIGHSAGAHLVSLISSNPDIVYSRGGKPWLGTVSLDSAAVDVKAIMTRPHRDVYDNAFGSDPNYWHQASPLETVTSSAPPLFLVCSTLRQDSCPANQKYGAAAVSLKVPAQVQPVALNHGQIDDQLGLPGAYTDAVDSFINGVLSRTPNAGAAQK